jgi:hypothetical protein
MREEALFLNGVYETVLDEILEIQASLPHQILFMQPFKSARIAHLATCPPTVSDSVQLLISTTTNLSTISHMAEIVGWSDKESITDKYKRVIDRVIGSLQPEEGALYSTPVRPERRSVNLLHVWRMQQIEHPFSVGELINTKDGSALSTNRTQAGGWVYVKRVDGQVPND